MQSICKKNEKKGYSFGPCCKKKYAEEDTAIEITGFGPDYIWTRLAILQQAGIISRLKGSFVNRMLSSDEGQVLPKSAKLSGNILVIFSVLGC